MNNQIKEVADKQIWETFIQTYAPQSLFQSWNWGETIKKQSTDKNVSCISRLGIFSQGVLVGIAQIHLVQAKKGKFFHLRHGPILKEWKNEYLLTLINFLKKRASNENIFYLRISPLLENTFEHNESLHSLGFTDSPLHAMDGEYVWVLKLDKTEDEILSQMRKTTRYLVKKAQKMGIVVTKSTNIQDFLVLYSETAKRHGFVKHNSISEEFEILHKDDQVDLFIGKYDNNLIAASLIVYYGNQAIYHHGASISNEIPASYLIQWEAIKEARKRGLSYYNFWGIAPENKRNHPWNGLSLFKKGFGGETKEYIHAKDLSFSPAYFLTYFSELIRKKRRGY